MSTCLGAAAAVAALGVSATSAAQVSEAFDAYEQTQISLRAAADGSNDLDWDDVDGFIDLDGVIAATALAETSSTATPIGIEPFEVAARNVGVIATDSNVVATLELGEWQGRPMDSGSHTRGDPVAIIGRVAANSLGLAPPYGQQIVGIEGHRVTVIGVFSASPRLPQLIDRVLVPRTWAESVGMPLRLDQLIVRTRVGAAEPIAQRAALIADPYQSEELLVSAPPTVERLRAQVAAEVDALVALMAAGAIIVGSVGISHASLVSVLRRQGEFALRQALGTTSFDLTLLVLFEGTLLGLVAGAAGAVFGTMVVVAIAAAQGWTPLLDIVWVVAAAGLAMLLGSLMSLYPAVRAARVEPAVGLRRLDGG